MKPSYEAEAAYLGQWVPTGAKLGLDLGCGYRKALPWLVGIDRRQGHWQDSQGAAHLSTPDVVADITRLPLAYHGADFICCSHVLEHFADPLAVVRYWTTLLRPGGRLAIVVPDYRYTFSCEQPDQKADPDGHRYDFTLPRLLKVVLQARNLEVLDGRLVCDNWSVGVAAERTGG